MELLTGFLSLEPAQKSFDLPRGRQVKKIGKEASEAPRPQGGASRRGSFVYIVPLDPRL
jgi:hypothetical protein